MAGRHLVLFARPSGIGHCRLGVTASRKIGSAVVRSRCRRRIRELFRLHQQEFGGMSLDLVVNARRGCEIVSWQELLAEYLRGVKKLRGIVEQG